MARKKDKELEQIKDKLGISRLWSWSRINSYMNDSYGYMLKYLLKIPEDRNDSMYGVSGSMCHSIMEDFYKGKLNHQQMLEKYEDKLFEFNALGLMYDRTNPEKNENIAYKYENCMRHFFSNHIKATDKAIIEPFILIKVGEHYFQGYIDFIHTEKNKIFITDWKTSSLYKGEKLLKESGQLLLYAEGIHQKTKAHYENIVIRFNFMKYVNVTYTQKKGDVKVRQIERNAIGSALQSNVKLWLKYFKYSKEDIDNYLNQMLNTNKIDCLPKEVREKFIIDDCYAEIDFDEDTINEHKNNIINTIEEIIQKELEYEKTKDKHIFWQEVDKKKSYYHAMLSGYSAKIHEPYKEYLDKLELQNGNIVSKNKDDNDLDWLDEIL